MKIAKDALVEKGYELVPLNLNQFWVQDKLYVMFRVLMTVGFKQSLAHLRRHNEIPN